MYLDETDPNVPASMGRGTQDLSGGQVFSNAFKSGFIGLPKALARWEVGGEMAGDVNQPRYSTEAEWMMSENYRPGLKYDQDMNQGTAELMADRFDEKSHEAWVADHWHGFGKGILNTVGSIAGSALDPLLWVPMVGQAERAALAAQAFGVAGRIGESALEGGAIMGGMSAAEAISDKSLGFDPDWTGVAINTLIGAGIGAVGGGVGAWLETRTTPERLQAVSVAADQLSQDKPVNVPRMSWSQELAASQHDLEGVDLSAAHTMTSDELNEIMGGPLAARAKASAWMDAHDPGVPAGVEAPVIDHATTEMEAPNLDKHLSEIMQADPDGIGARIQKQLDLGEEEALTLKNRAKALLHAAGCLARELL